MRIIIQSIKYVLKKTKIVVIILSWMAVTVIQPNTTKMQLKFVTDNCKI